MRECLDSYAQRASARGGGALCAVHGALLEKGPLLLERYLARVDAAAGAAESG